MLKWHFCPPPSLQFFLSNGFHLFLFWKRILVVQDGITLKTRSFSLFHLVQSQTICRCHSVCWCHLIFRSPSNDTKDDVNDDHGHMKILNDDVLNLRPRQKHKTFAARQSPKWWQNCLNRISKCYPEIYPLKIIQLGFCLQTCSKSHTCLFALCQNQSAHVLAYSFFGSGKVEKKDSQEVQVNAHTKIMSIWSKWPRCPSVVGVWSLKSLREAVKKYGTI